MELKKIVSELDPRKDMDSVEPYIKAFYRPQHRKERIKSGLDYLLATYFLATVKPLSRGYTLGAGIGALVNYSVGEDPVRGAQGGGVLFGLLDLFQYNLRLGYKIKKVKDAYRKNRKDGHYD